MECVDAIEMLVCVLIWFGVFLEYWELNVRILARAKTKKLWIFF